MGSSMLHAGWRPCSGSAHGPGVRWPRYGEAGNFGGRPSQLRQPSGALAGTALALEPLAPGVGPHAGLSRAERGNTSRLQVDLVPPRGPVLRAGVTTRHRPVAP